ncbi:hypothetical protein TBR22_A40450 [Luteitalea sp. TBR-22]|uniref:hypothetical protein n=1 Tax=Luteitalea sp. TBR-22 TaxID=2802971 RepID=UPI001AFA8362|nr:hypothetical protein [Luteitalea sp. TBR-22]BCS34819.1 hypothetical protein TBR22_A40450 [Luteitalea sp. TBR-22]
MTTTRVHLPAVAAAFALALLPTLVSAQPVDRGPAVAGAPARPVGPRPPERPPTARSWSGLVRFGNAYDSNIDQNETNHQAFGVILGTGVQYVDDPSDPSVQFTYETGLHRYGGTDRWNRVSHYARGQVTQDLPWRWAKLDVIGELSLKGTTEERELSNQANVTPRLNLRLSRRNRLRVLAAWRERRYDDAARDASNRYVGTEFSHRGGQGREWTIEARVERNHAASNRYDWDRFTWGGEYVVPLGRRGRLELELKYRRVLYTSRTVEINDEDVLRRDHRWTPTIVWRHAITPMTELRLGYTRDSRDSNDVRRDFAADQALFGITRRF